MGFFSSSNDPLLNEKAKLIVNDLFVLFDNFDNDLKNNIPGLQVIERESVKFRFITAGSYYLTTILAGDKSISNRKYTKLIDGIYIAGNSKNPIYEEQMKYCKEILKTSIGNIREWKGTEQDLFNQIKLTIGLCAPVPIPVELQSERFGKYSSLIGEYIIYKITMYWKIKRDTYLPF